jgi:hypothetical protein
MAVVSLGGSNELGVEIVGRGTAVTISDHKRRSEDKGRPTGGGEGTRRLLHHERAVERASDPSEGGGKAKAIKQSDHITSSRWGQAPHIV